MTIIHCFSGLKDILDVNKISYCEQDSKIDILDVDAFKSFVDNLLWIIFLWKINFVREINSIWEFTIPSYDNDYFFRMALKYSNLNTIQAIYHVITHNGDTLKRYQNIYLDLCCCRYGYSNICLWYLENVLIKMKLME
jgi:hypothetical protein